MKRVLIIVAASVVAISVCFVAAFIFLLWQPSVRGQCEKPDHHTISTLRGQVVGKSLEFIQYRWLRRRFKAAGVKLTLQTQHFETRPGIGEIPTGKFVRTLTVGDSGTFDFGDLVPDEYVLSVDLPGEDSVAFHFAVDPAAHNTDVLIDASPAYYCRCCGWDFEPR